MTKKEAKDILLKFVEDNKYNSDWNGFLAGAISTYLEPIYDEKLFDEIDNVYNSEYSEGEYCHKQSFSWGFQEGVDWINNRS